MTAVALLPRNLADERALLGALLVRPELLREAPDLEPGHMFDLRNRKVLEAMRNLEAIGATTFDLEAVDREIALAGATDAVGGIAYLGELALAANHKDKITIAEVRDRSARIRNAAVKRDAAVNGEYRPRSELVVDVGRKDIPPIRSYSTGNPQLDNLLGGGINTRELAVVLGPPGGCKTAFAISLAVHLQRSVPLLYASTELEQHELMARVAANVLGKPWGGIRRGTVERSVIAEALDGLNIRLLGCDLLPMDGDAALKLIEREAKWIAEQQKQPPTVVIDYLQDLARGAERDVRSRVGDHARAVRALSQRLDCAAVAISSVARTFYSARKAAEFREADDPTVYLAAAKESGDVDYAAARVLFLDAEDERDRDERAVRIAVAKSRDARTGFAGARVHQESGRFFAAPDVLGEMAQSGRAAESTTMVSDEADDAMFKRLVREHTDGKRALCTQRYLRVGNKLGRKTIGKERAQASLDRLVEAGRARLVTIERIEGGKAKSRDIYEPVGGSS